MNNTNLKLGCVWHGPWHKGLLKGKFGTPSNYHFAMVYSENYFQYSEHTAACFPFTSKKKGKAVLILPPGSVPWGNREKTSYLLAIRLVVEVVDLKTRFKYKNILNPEQIRQFEENYKKIIKARRKK